MQQIDPKMADEHNYPSDTRYSMQDIRGFTRNICSSRGSFATKKVLYN